MNTTKNISDTRVKKQTEHLSLVLAVQHPKKDSITPKQPVISDDSNMYESKLIYEFPYGLDTGLLELAIPPSI